MKQKLTLVLAAALSIGMLATIAAIAAIIYLHRQTHDDQSEIVQNLARSIANIVERDVAGIDYVLQVSAEETERQLSASQATYDSVTTFLGKQQDRFSNMDLLRATNPEGETVYGRGVDPTQRASLAHRDYFKQLMENPKLGMVISEPVIGKISQKWIWLMARRLNNPDQSFAGIVYASIFIDDLVKRFEQFKLVPGSAISLRDQNMKVIARTTFDATPPLPIGDSRLSKELQQALSQPSMSGTYQSGATTADGVSRIYAYQRSEKYGFTLLVGIPKTYITDLWLRQSTFVATLLVTFLVGLLFGTRLVSRRIADQLRIDINATREAERALLKTLVQSIPNLIWLKDPDGVYLACNVEFERFFGHLESEIVGKTDYDFVATDLAKFFRDHDRAAMAAGKPTVNEEWITYASDGHHAYLVTTKTPMYGPDGNVIGVLGVAQDITVQKEAAQELAQSRALLDSVIDSVPLRIFWKDKNSRYLGCNSLFARDAGKSAPDEVIGKLDDDLHWANQADRYHADDRQVMESGLSKLNDEESQTMPDGQVIYVRTSIVPLRVGQGEVSGVLGIYDDITERKKTELALLEERQVRDTILESIPGISYALDAGGFFTFWNHNFQRATGRSTAELQHCNAADLFEGEHRAHIIERIQQTFVQGKSDAEADLVSTDGQRTRYYFTGRRIEMGGQPILVGVGVDVGPLKAAEQNLRQLNEELEERVRQNTADLKASYVKLRDTEFAMDSVGIGIHWVDFDSGRFIHANRFAAELLGYSQEELLQRTVSDIDPHFPQAAFREIADRIRQSGFLKFETEQIKRDGSYVPVEMTVYYHAGDSLTPPRMISFMQNITDRKRAAQELLEAKATAEVATTAKSAFLANMSHEIRTPLNAITGMTHLIRKSGVNAVQNDRLGKIEIAGAHLLEIINSILDLSKIEAGKFTLEEVALDVGAIVANVVSILSQQAVVRKIDIEIDNQLSFNNFVGDPTRLQQGLLNFGSNAIKFSDKGRVTIHVELLESDAETALLRFEVEDQGIGIEAAALSRLFSAFEQADNTTTRQYGGTGLGLAITKKLAQLMGGDAGATSELGQGSRFWFTARLGLGVQGAISQALVPSLQAETILARDYADRKLLLVEDDLFNQEITLIILQEIWPVVDLAEDGLQAVERVKDKCYDLILMDMQMPRMDGLDATRQIRTLPNGFGVPVIAMTGNAFLEDRNRCYDAGMNDFLAKPVRPADLFEVILKWIRR
jgi:PAS domain S-box-containing protein